MTIFTNICLFVSSVVALLLLSISANASDTEQYAPKADTAYYIHEGTKVELVSVGSNNNVLRWASSNNKEEQLWEFRGTSRDQTYIRSLKNDKYMTTALNSGNITVEGYTGDTGQKYRIERLTDAQAQKAAPLLFSIFNAQNIAKRILQEPDSIVFVRIIEETREERVAVGSNGNIRRWSELDDKTQVFALQESHTISKTKPKAASVNSAAVKTFISKLPAQKEFSGNRDAVAGVVEVVPQIEAIKLDKAGEYQVPGMSLKIKPHVTTRAGVKYVAIDLTESLISATNDNDGLEYDQSNKRGYFLEKADIEIVMPKLTRNQVMPQSSKVEGSTGSSSGGSFGGGGGADKSGPNASISGSVDFSNSYSQALEGISIENTTPALDLTKASTQYYLSAVIAPEAGLVGKGGTQLYTKPSDLARSDAAGQFSGYPLGYLPPQAIASLPVITRAEFQVPSSYSSDVVSFDINIKLTLRLVEVGVCDGKIIQHCASSSSVTRSIKRKFNLNINPSK